MIKTQQAALYLQQLQQQYPQAFKRNVLLYGQIKVKGLLDDWKELIPWGLAAMIFVSTAFVLGQWIEVSLPRFDATQSVGIGILAILLFFMLTVPIIIRQIKFSSKHLYQQLQHTPLKLAILIILQGLNIAFLNSVVLQAAIFFFGLSFGFVKFYKENMFRSSSTAVDHYHLQQIRKACLWSHQQTIKAKSAMKFLSRDSDKYKIAQQHLAEFSELYVQLIKYENDLAMSCKFTDLDEYVDSMM